jgi:hypothetical protein
MDGESIEWSALAPSLAEAAGGLVVEELALDRLVLRELGRRGVMITDADLEHERAWLAASVVGATELQGTDAGRLIAEVRARRGLGPVRFDAMLRRNAALRALVRGQVEVRDDQVELAWRVQHGARVRVRLITTGTQREALHLRDQALAAPPERAESRFAELAEAHSTDPSAPRGGLIEPFSLEDPAFEPSIRLAAAPLTPGQVGPVVAIRNGFAVLYLDETVPADGVTLEASRDALAEQLRSRQERLRMDQLATQLLAGVQIRVFDDSLRWSVEAGREP